MPNDEQSNVSWHIMYSADVTLVPLSLHWTAYFKIVEHRYIVHMFIHFWECKKDSHSIRFLILVGRMKPSEDQDPEPLGEYES